MMQLTLDEFKILAKDASRIAVFQEIAAGSLTPLTIYSLLQKAFKTNGMMLEDLLPQKTLRYSFICFEPIASLKLDDKNKIEPLKAIRDLQAKFKVASRPDVADLITSAAGFITYDAVRFFEELPDRHNSDAAMPSILFNFYNLSLAFDHQKQTLLISTIAKLGNDLEKSYNQAQQKIKVIQDLLLTSSADEETSCELKKTTASTLTVTTSDPDFMQMVEKAKTYIKQGDAFQIVLSRCFKRNYSVSPLEIYKTLRQVSPVPFMFYVPTENSIIMGASPERFVRVQNQRITVNPIAGTRKRSKHQNDENIANDLMNDKKEVAEHMMLVDLARNDVGAVSNPGSVRVDELMKVKHYSHVSHITSTVTGVLKKSKDALDALIASFPAGTLSGAPKIRAMQIIDELETSRRGIYGGAICRLTPLGNLDSCIAIRMVTLQDGVATVRAGAGIVHDSNPANEAQETYHKAHSMLAAIAQAHGENYVINN